VVRPLAFLAFAVLAAPAWAQDFVLPEGFGRVDEEIVEDGLTYLYTVRPVAGAFAELSSIRVSEVVEPGADADAWLKGRLSADVGDAGAAKDMLESPDSPFADPAFDSLRRALPQIFADIETLAELPLRFCDGPQTGYNASGAYRELSCAFSVGPLRQFLVLRLQAVAGRTYFTEIRTMNERRLRHLLAIADTFAAGDI
jgi:hypothetical protein